MEAGPFRVRKPFNEVYMHNLGQNNNFMIISKGHKAI